MVARPRMQRQHWEKSLSSTVAAWGSQQLLLHVAGRLHGPTRSGPLWHASVAKRVPTRPHLDEGCVVHNEHVLNGHGGRLADHDAPQRVGYLQAASPPSASHQQSHQHGGLPAAQHSMFAQLLSAEPSFQQTRQR